MKSAGGFHSDTIGAFLRITLLVITTNTTPPPPLAPLTLSLTI